MDRSSALEAVERNWRALERLPDVWKGDRDVVLAAVRQSVLALRYADDSLKGDKDVVLVVVRQNGRCLEYASDALKRDRDVVLAAVRQSVWVLRYADDSLKGDKDVMLAVVRQRGNYLKYASDALKRDKDVVLAAVRQSVLALRYADDSLKGDKDVVLVVVRQNGRCLEYASDALKRDRDVVLAAVRQSVWVLRHAFDRLKEDEDVMAAIRRSVWALYASMDLLGDKEVAFVALTNDPECIQYIPDELKGGRSADDLLAYLKAEIISTLPERYRVGARELLETKAHISSEIPFVLQDRGLSDVFKMEWARRTLTPVDIFAYRENLSKLLAMRVILQLCDGDIHSERFAHMCTRMNIDSLSVSINRGLDGLDIEALVDIYCRLEEIVGVSVDRRLEQGVHAMDQASAVPPFAPPSVPPFAPPSSLTQFVHDRLAIVIPGIEFSEGFFRSYIREHTQEHAPQERQQLQV